tara:strand:- start:299 stop:1543 length:1245 start_codon:yes stop_codon:yes gene_type:complete
MAKRDILKEAIADAKAVKETAIANAKAALEEAFTPQLKSMLAAKLEEMDLEEENEVVSEEVEVKEELEEEINLDEILAEIEEISEENIEEETVTEETVTEETVTEETVNEEESEDAEEAEEEESEEAEEAEDEEINLDEMSDEDLKEFIEDVIADMVASGELEAGDNAEKDEDTEEEVSMEVEDSVEEVEITEDETDLKEEKVDEINTTTGQSFKKQIDPLTGKPMVNPFDSGEKSLGGEAMKALASAGLNLAKLPKEIAARLKKWSDDFEKPEKYAQSGNKVAKRPGSSGVGIYEEGEELAEAYSTIETLKSDLNEVNLLNAKLLYTNKIFKAKTLTESQKVKVLGAFDKASTVKESKLVFETLSEGLKTKKVSPIKESLGSASRVSRNINTKKPIIETDPMVERFKKLAGLK